jgi:colicin import membrane protein
MKKSYVYFIVPLVALVVFGGFYYNFKSNYEAKLEQAALKIKQEKQAKLDLDNAQKKKAYDEAVAASERRKAEKAAKEKQDAEERDAREQALEDLDKARRDSASLDQKVDRLTKEVESTKKEIAGLELQKKDAVEEQAFLAVYVKQAEANVQSLQTVLDKIKAADDAAAAAAKAAADAAKAAKKS